MALATLSIDIIAKLARMEADMGKASRIAEKNAQKIERAFDGIGKAMRAGVAGITFGVLMKKFVDETVSAQREQAQLAAVLQSTGMAAGFSRDQLNAMATDLAKSSIFSEGEINQAQARLLAYTGIVGKEFPEAMQIVVDMADRMGMSLEQSAETIGRALDVPSQGMASLTKQGFRFSEEQKKLVKSLEDTGRTAEAQAIVIDALKSSYGGAAQATRNTFGGSIAALKNQLNDLMVGSDGSLEGAREAVEDLTKTLGSAETKAAFDTLTGLLASTLKLTVQATNGLAAMAAELKNFGKSPAAITTQIDSLQRELQKLEGMRGQGFTVFGFFGSEEDREHEIANIEDQLQRLRAKLVDAAAFSQMDFTLPMQPGRRGGGGGGHVTQQKLKSGDPNMGPRTFAETYGKDIAKLFDDSVITRAAKFQVSLEMLDDLYFRGIVGAKEYDAAVAELSGSTSTGADATSKFMDAQKRLQELIDAGPAATLERQREDMKLLAKAYEDGRFGIVGTTDAIKAYGDVVNHTLGNVGLELEKKLDAMSVFAEQAGRNIQDALGDTLSKTLKGDFDSIGEMWGNLLLDMAAQAMAVQLNQYLFGDFDKKTSSWSGVLGPLLKSFGGFFAEGGNLGAGKWGIAGEAGPEVVKGPAQIVPMAQLGRGGGGGAPTINVYQSYNIAPGVSPAELVRSMQLTREQAKADVYESMRRGGAFAR